MKELYLAIAVLCFLVGAMVYCVNKSVRALRELYYTWKSYKIISKEILDYLKEKK
ncbi:hypothetical protein KA005_78205 [bacterium]|nr:hypothetical protein [bacterium]